VLKIRKRRLLGVIALIGVGVATVDRDSAAAPALSSLAVLLD